MTSNGSLLWLILSLGLVAAQLTDLEPCVGVSSFKASRCPDSACLACWSADAAVDWVCLAGGARAPSEATWSSHCMSRSPQFSGACIFAAEAEQWTLPPLLSWAKARDLAKAALAAMTPSEKHGLLQGVGWHNWTLERGWYVGNTAGVPRLGIPSLNMQDAAAGFRTYWSDMTDTVTAWPSLLALAATWDPDLVQDFAIALGQEFAGKGANTILGPSVNVHRVARNGRNFEYLSGEDPYLGSQLVEGYVMGVQSQGIMAVLKHWVFNEQETKRDWENSIVDDKTASELYYPPFQAAIDAGVSAVMCSYNVVNGVHSCSNQHQLNGVLRGQLGFQGFVQSDWWAAHTNALAAGLDQEMPGTGAKVFYGAKQTALYPELADESVLRILSAMKRLNLSAKCSPPHCSDWLLRNVTSAKHVALARSVAAESIVLLKNENDILPLLPSNGTTRIAIVGAAVAAASYDPNGAGQGSSNSWHQGDYYSGGGSGHVTSTLTVTPLQGLSRRAAQAGMSVVAAPSDNVSEALAAALEADVVLVVAATTSGESVDRASLDLDGNVSDLIKAVSRVSKRVVVLVQAPGAVLMPWRGEVQAILALFLGGQETGSAWADVVFGDVSPSGRLPIMLPATEADTIAPGESLDVRYSEGLATSYRNPAFTAAFPFGHGLSYTEFRYLTAITVPCTVSQALICIQLSLHNSGSRPGRHTAQLYLQLPLEGQPVVLKGFRKTPTVLPAAEINVTFLLYDRDLSYFAAGSWLRPKNATAHIGDSSASLLLSVPFQIPPRPPRPVPRISGCQTAGLPFLAVALAMHLV